MFNDSLDWGALPQTLTEASIILLLKPDKDSFDCSSYHLNSLLNVDYKILAKTLALQLESVMPNIISPDQTGFMKNRHSFSNIRCLLDIICSPASIETPEVVVSLDAKKAFDRVEWDYLFEILKRFCISSKFISWILLLYSSSKAPISNKGMKSQYFKLSRGSRQRCPLSPLLFALAIEPLSITLKSASFDKRILRCGSVHKLSLYADDLLFVYFQPFPQLIKLLIRFGIFSGYKLNFSKS